MDKSQWQIRPGFLVSLLIVFVVIPWILQTVIFAPKISDKTRARIIVTRSCERAMALLLQERADTIGGLTNIDNQFILDSIFASQKNQAWFNTNAAGELIDVWQTPYRIELAGHTNCIIKSAGQNHTFGDKNDIIFNSTSNDFVRP
jgi:hypothetical protein